MISEKFGDFKPELVLEVIRDDAVADMIGVSGGGFAIGAVGDVVDRSAIPAEAGPHEKPVVFRDVLEDFCKRAFQAFCTKFGRALQDLLEISCLQGRAAKLAKQGLLPKAVRKFVPNCRKRYKIRRLPAGFQRLEHGKSCDNTSRPIPIARFAQFGLLPAVSLSKIAHRIHAAAGACHEQNCSDSAFDICQFDHVGLRDGPPLCLCGSLARSRRCPLSLEMDV